jgi:hypothetical protein
MSMTTREIEQAALAVPCPEHKVIKGKACPARPDGAFGDACMSRRELASARRILAAFPIDEELATLGDDDIRMHALWMRDAAQALSDCVDVALGPVRASQRPAQLPIRAGLL